MNYSQKICEFLQLENTDDILLFKTENGLLIWPPLRYFILSHLYNRTQGLSELGPSQGFGLGKLCKLLMLFILYNPIKILLNKKIVNLFFYSSVTNFRVGNVFVNRVVDYFFSIQKENSYCLETLYNKEINRPRVHNRIAYAIFLNGFAKLMVRIGIVRNTTFETKQVSQLLSLLNKRSANKFAMELQKIHNEVLHLLALAKAQYIVYDFFFRRSSIKRLILEDAAYGGTSYVQYAAKRNGIIVIEPQHGAITKEHLGYNFGDCIARSEAYKEYLPDYFLSYGRYWKEQVNLPVPMVAVGNPYLSEYLKEARIREDILSKSILIISPGTTQEETEFVTLSLKQCLGDLYKIKLRPHPLEKFEANIKYKSLLDKGVELDITPKVYDSIVQADCIIGDISTVLFEAIAFKKIVISYNSKINPPIGFPSNLVHVTSLEDVVETTKELLQKRNRLTTGDLTYVWQTNWEENFTSFLQKLN